MGVDLAPPVALLFPGQGVQRPGMGRRLHDRYAVAAAAFQRAEEILNLPIRRLCFEGPESELNR
ncbi:MAG: malonyl CoA-acyl carrier protein transacylase, partial [Candidatus Dormibacteraeota bacterium]|nr:malonyl CoA-acyl carrier protein transacylase [Candidatus Dormibacteraeota bacterium]